MNNVSRIRASFLEQADLCQKLGSSFMQHLLSGVGRQLDASTETGKRILDWPGNPEPKSDALALRLAGGLHALARKGSDEELTSYYQDTARSSESGFLPCVMSSIASYDAELVPWLDFAPQTNEVARASAIYAGLSVIASRFNLPLSLFEMGCSGGLNLQCAQFGYCFNGKGFGNPRSTLLLEPNWKGAVPPMGQVEIVSRQGCDLNPLLVSNQEDAEKLVAYLWPDQPMRIARVETAIVIAKGDPPKLEKAGAAEWVENKLLSNDGSGVVRVLYDTIAWNYFPQGVKDRINQHMDAIGSRATAENPLAWLTFEFDREDNGPFLKLTTWPASEGVEVLAAADSHVYGIEWLSQNH